MKQFLTKPFTFDTRGTSDDRCFPDGSARPRFDDYRTRTKSSVIVKALIDICRKPKLDTMLINVGKWLNAIKPTFAILLRCGIPSNPLLAQLTQGIGICCRDGQRFLVSCSASSYTCNRDAMLQGKTFDVSLMHLKVFC